MRTWYVPVPESLPCLLASLVCTEGQWLEAMEQTKAFVSSLVDLTDGWTVDRLERLRCNILRSVAPASTFADKLQVCAASHLSRSWCA